MFSGFASCKSVLRVFWGKGVEMASGKLVRVGFFFVGLKAVQGFVKGLAGRRSEQVRISLRISPCCPM